MTTNKVNLTYQEVKLRLTRCEERLGQLKIKESGKVDYSKQISKMKILKESLHKKLKESEENMFVSTKAGDTKAVSMTKKQAADLKKDPNVTDITTTKGADLKEQEGIEFSKSETTAIAKEVGKALAIALRSYGDELNSMKIVELEPNSFDIKAVYKNDSEDRFSFYIVEDTLHLVDFSFDKELVDIGVKPSGEAIVHVDVLANELMKHFKSLNEAMTDQEFADAQEKERLDKHPEKSTIEKIKALLDKERKAEMDENESHDQGGDLDIGHQDDEPDMLKQYAYDIAQYAAKLYKQLDKYDKMDAEVDFPNWWQSKVILAREYISKAQHYLEFEEKQPALDQLALEGKINEAYNINPEAEKTVLRFIKGLTKKYGYGMEDAAFLIKQVLSNQGLDEASAEEEERFHKKLDTLVHKTFGKRKEELEEGEGWGSSDNFIFNQSIHKALGEPTKMPSPFDTKLEDAVEDAVDTYWDDWEEYDYNREGLLIKAKRNYLRAYFKDTFDRMIQMFSESVNEVKTYKKGDKLKIKLKNGKKFDVVFDSYSRTKGVALGKFKNGSGEYDTKPFDLDTIVESVNEARNFKKAKQALIDFNNGKIGEDDMVKSVVKSLGFKFDEFSEEEAGLELSFNIIKGKIPTDDYVLNNVIDVLSESVNEASVAKLQKQLADTKTQMRAIAVHYKGGNKEVVPLLKKLTVKKKELESQLEKAVSGIGVGQEFDDSVEESKKKLTEAKATCCGKCGRVHVKGTECKRPFLKGKDHCRFN